MKSLAERLEEAFTYHADSVERCDPAGMADARSTIHRIYMECIPEERESMDGKACSCFANNKSECGCGADWSDFKEWNNCRTETLKKMEGMRK